MHLQSAACGVTSGPQAPARAQACCRLLSPPWRGRRGSGGGGDSNPPSGPRALRPGGCSGAAAQRPVPQVLALGRAVPAPALALGREALPVPRVREEVRAQRPPVQARQGAPLPPQQPCASALTPTGPEPPDHLPHPVLCSNKLLASFRGTCRLPGHLLEPGDADPGLYAPPPGGARRRPGGPSAFLRPGRSPAGLPAWARASTRLLGPKTEDVCSFEMSVPGGSRAGKKEVGQTSGAAMECERGFVQDASLGLTPGGYSGELWGAGPGLRVDVGLGDKPPLSEVAVHVLELNVQGRRTDAGLPQGDGTCVAQPLILFPDKSRRQPPGSPSRGEGSRCVACGRAR